MQDIVIHNLRKFATEKNVHLTLVAHPRKELQSLTLDSISGTAKIVQDADNVLLLQRQGKSLLLDVVKNRYDGQRGQIGLKFDLDSSCVWFY